MDNTNEVIKKDKNSKSKFILNIILGIVIVVIFSYYLLSSPERDRDVTIHVSPNDTLTQISNDLKNKKVIKRPFIFSSLVYLFSGDRHISPGDYLFKKDLNIFDAAWQISKGKHGVSPIRITFKEGITRIEMANILADKLSNFRKDIFLSDVRSKEGYLFPDTYFFYPMSTTDEILYDISSNFEKRLASINKNIKSSNKSLSDIIIMASILEKEANDNKDAPIISGILWKRIELDMPLQVDAAPITYNENGLPKNPISNPGLSFISHAINPEESPYLFYLHDDNGQVHYANNFSEHRSNISRYLK